MDRGRAVKRSRSGENKSRSRSRGRDRSRDRPPGAKLADKRVYISNIPYDSRWQDIKDLFRKEVGEVAFVELFSDESEKARGCGIIEFESPISAKKAIEKMHRFELGGRKIVVKEDYDVERDKFGRIVTGGSGGGAGGGAGGGGGRRDDMGGNRGVNRDRSRDDRDRGDRNDWNDRRIDQGGLAAGGGGGGGGANWKYGNTYGLSSQFLESLGIDGPLISRVFISNLDFRVDEKKLKEVFRLAGRVLDVDLNKDKDGKSRGHGVIEFEHPVEAVQAISMLNNQQLFDRRMHVKMDRLADPLSDLAKNKLPEGLKGVGMGLGMNGQPLHDVSKSVSTNSNNNTGGGGGNLIGSGGGSTGGVNNLATPMNTLTTMNMNQGMSNLASMMAGQQSMDIGSMPSAAAAVAAANVFGVASGMGHMGALNAAAANQFANMGNAGNAGNLAAALQNSAAGLSGLQGNPGGGGGNPLNMMGSNQNQMSNQGNMSGASIGSASGAQNQPSPFQTNPGSGQSGNPSFRDMEYGYSTSVYSTPSSNYNTAYQREKQQFGNGVSSGNLNVGNVSGGGAASNTVIVANLPPSCTWQMLKTKFRECGEVVFAEMRDKSTGIVRFATERDAERAVKVFDQSRVDGRIVEVRFL